MQKAVISFIISALIGLGIGYLVFQVVGDKDQPEVATSETTDTHEDTSNEAANHQEAETVSVNDNILSAKGCLGCHAVSKLNLQGGATGPDLSQAFNNVEGKHGKPLEEFLKEPTSAVMSGVISGNPLSDDEINQIVDVLQEAANQQ